MNVCIPNNIAHQHTYTHKKFSYTYLSLYNIDRACKHCYVYKTVVTTDAMRRYSMFNPCLCFPYFDYCFPTVAYSTGYINRASSSFQIQSKANSIYVGTVGNALMTISPGQPIEEEQCYQA